MKFYLKNFSLILFCLVVIATLAMRPTPQKTNTKARSCTLFVYVPDILPSVCDPTEYIIAPLGFDPDLDCPGATDLCAICTDQIYPSTDPNFPNKPKVNIPGDCTIKQRIIDVLTNPTQEGIPDVCGNIVWLWQPF